MIGHIKTDIRLDRNFIASAFSVVASRSDDRGTRPSGSKAGANLRVGDVISALSLWGAIKDVMGHYNSGRGLAEAEPGGRLCGLGNTPPTRSLRPHDFAMCNSYRRCGAVHIDDEAGWLGSPQR